VLTGDRPRQIVFGNRKKDEKPGDQLNQSAPFNPDGKVVKGERNCGRFGWLKAAKQGGEGIALRFWGGNRPRSNQLKLRSKKKHTRARKKREAILGGMGQGRAETPEGWKKLLVRRWPNVTEVSDETRGPGWGGVFDPWRVFS